MTTRRPFDFSLLAITVLLAVQATIAAYGFRTVRDVAVYTHQEIARVGQAAR